MRVTLRAFALFTTGLLLAVGTTGCQSCSLCRGYVPMRIGSGLPRLGLPRLGLPRFLSRSDQHDDHNSFQSIEPMAVPYEPGPGDHRLVLPSPGPTTGNVPGRLPEATLPPAVSSFNEDAVPSAGLSPLRPINHQRPTSHLRRINHEVSESGDKGVIQPVCHKMFGGSCSTCVTTCCPKEGLLSRLRRRLSNGFSRLTCKSYSACSPCPSPCEPICCDPCFTGSSVIYDGVAVGGYPLPSYGPTSFGPHFTPSANWSPQPAYGQPPCNCQRQQPSMGYYPPQQYPQPQYQPQQQRYPAPPQYGSPQPQTGQLYPTPAYPGPGTQHPTPVPTQQPTPVTFSPGYSPVQPTYSPVGANFPQQYGTR